jgi:c-di-GMP phosphodiesterase
MCAQYEAQPQLILRWQPIVRAGNRQLILAEALARDPVTMMVPDITDFHIAQLCLERALVESTQLVNRGVLAAINIEPSMLYLLLDMVENPAGFLFELTERGEPNLEVLEKLGERGFRFAIDDWPLQHAAHNLVVIHEGSVVKISMEFFKTETPATLTKAIDTVHSARMEVIVEGIEHEEDASRAILAGTDYLQGNFIGSPMTLQELAEFARAA